MSSPSRTISRIPGEGASVIPLIGRELLGYDPDTYVPEGVQSVIGVGFRSKWRGTESELLTWLGTTPTSEELAEYDDGPAFRSAWAAAMKLGYPLIINEVSLINSAYETAAEAVVTGKRVELIGHANGCLVGGPGLENRMVWAANSSSSGSTAARSLDVIVRNMRTNLQYAPAGSLNSVNHYNFSGFRRTIFEYNNLYSGAHYSTAGGDAGLFSTSNDVIVHGCRFQGMIDLAIYPSGSNDGTQDLYNATYSANTYIGCANGWAPKRNYRYIKSIGEHFDACYNCVSATPAGGTDDGQLSGSRIAIVGMTAHNIASRVIDPRGSSNLSVKGLVVSGRFGYDYLNAVVANAAVIGIAGSTNCDIEAVIDVDTSVYASDATHAAVRITSYTNAVNGVTYVSSGNSVKVVAKNIYNGLLEFSPSEKNTVELNLTDVTNPVTMPSSNATRVIINNEGARSELLGNFDSTPDRTPFGGTVRSASFAIPLSGEDRYLKCQPTTTLIQATLPTGAPNGYMVGLTKVAGSGPGLVVFRDPTNSFNVGSPIREIGETLWAVCDGADGWRPIQPSFNRFGRFRNQSWLPTGWVRDSYQRNTGASQNQALTSGRLFLCAFEGLEGDLATSIKFMCGAAAVGLTNRWFALYDSSLNLLGVSGDDATAWAVGDILSLDLAAGVRLPYSGLFYAGICETASTSVSSVRGTNGSSNMLGLAPILVGNSTTGLTNAASAPATAGAISAVSITPYCGIG